MWNGDFVVGQQQRLEVVRTSFVEVVVDNDAQDLGLGAVHGERDGVFTGGIFDQPGQLFHGHALANSVSDTSKIWNDVFSSSSRMTMAGSGRPR